MSRVLVSAGPADAPVLAAIHRAAFPPGETWDEEAIARVLELPGCFGLIDLDGGMLLGRTAADEAEILTLAVAPAARRRGVAGALLRAAGTAARQAGATALFLEVSAANGSARALYAAAGFAEVGRRPRYYPDGADALVLRRAVDG